MRVQALVVLVIEVEQFLFRHVGLFAGDIIRQTFAPENYHPIEIMVCSAEISQHMCKGALAYDDVDPILRPSSERPLQTIAVNHGAPRAKLVEEPVDASVEHKRQSDHLEHLACKRRSTRGQVGLAQIEYE